MRKIVLLLFSLTCGFSYGQDTRTLQVLDFHPLDREDHLYIVVRVGLTGSGAFSASPDDSGRIQITAGQYDSFRSSESMENPGTDQYYLMTYGRGNDDIQVTMSLDEVGLLPFLRSVEIGARYVSQLAGVSPTEFEQAGTWLNAALRNFTEPYSIDVDRSSIKDILQQVRLDTGYDLVMAENSLTLMQCPEQDTACESAMNAAVFSQRNRETIVLHLDDVDAEARASNDWRMISFDSVNRASSINVFPDEQGAFEHQTTMLRPGPKYENAIWQHYLVSQAEPGGDILFFLNITDAPLNQFVRSLQMAINAYLPRMTIENGERIRTPRIRPQYLPGMDKIRITLEGRFLTLDQVNMGIERETGCRVSVVEHQVIAQYCP